MSRMPTFARPGAYIEHRGPTRDWPTLRPGQTPFPLYIRLGARASPLKYNFAFAASSAGAGASQPKTFQDLEPLPTHIYQVFLGVSRGSRVRVYHPVDIRTLKWDQRMIDVQEKDTANIEYEDSPIDDPQFSFWITVGRNFVPALDVENVEVAPLPARALNVNVLLLAAGFEYQLIDPAVEPELQDKLVRRQIPSIPVTFGGRPSSGGV